MQPNSGGRSTKRGNVESEIEMTLTRDFKELVKARLDRDPKARQALLREAVQSMLEGDVDTGKAVLRDYINATVGFEELGKATGTPPKSLMRMFSPRGNPQAKNLFAVIEHLQRKSGISIEVRVEH